MSIEDEEESFRTGPELLTYCEARTRRFQEDEKERVVDEGLGLFSVEFWHSQPDEGQGILDALQDSRFLKHLPQLTGLSLKELKMPNVAVGAVELLQTGRIRWGLSLDLSFNDIGDAGACALAKALKSGKCPEGLTLNLSFNRIGDEGACALADALKSGQCPIGLTLTLWEWENAIGDKGACALADALKSGKCPAGLTLNLWSHHIGEAGALAFADALKSGQCPAGLTLDLSSNDIGYAGVCALADALKSGQCPAGLTLALWDNTIGDAGARALAEALKSGQCPIGLTLNLRMNGIGDAGARALADALKSGCCPSGLTLVLGGGNGIGDAGARALADALKSGQCPAGLTLDLRMNGISEAGVCALAEALKSGQCPAGLTLDLPLNRMGEAGARALAEALKSGQCPEGLTLVLSNNDIGDAGVCALAEALEQGLAQGNLPPGLKIDLCRENISAGPLARINRVLEKNNQLGLMQAVFCAEQFIKNSKKINSRIYDQNMLSMVATFLAPAAVGAQKALDERVDEYSRLSDKAIKARVPKDRPVWLKDGMTLANCTYDYWLGVRLINEDEKGSVRSLEDEFAPFRSAGAYSKLKAQVSWYKAWDRIPLLGQWIHRLFNFFNFNQSYRHEILLDFYEYAFYQNQAERPPVEEKGVLDGSPSVEQSQGAGAVPLVPYRKLVEVRNTGARNEVKNTENVTNPEANKQPVVVPKEGSVCRA